jgi:hypothetical protein
VGEWPDISTVLMPTKNYKKLKEGIIDSRPPVLDYPSAIKKFLGPQG